MARPLTFVTAFLDWEEDRSKDKSVERCFSLFSKLAATGIPIHLFLSSSYRHMLPLGANVFVDYIELQDLDTYKEIEGVVCKLPTDRTPHHDTKNFLILMNSKIEFLHRAAAFQDSSHYAWIDFSIFHVVKDEAATTKYLQMLASTALKDECLVIPGCWAVRPEPSFSAICWRFCGGFLLGDKGSIETMYQQYRQCFLPVVYTKGLVWEVNMWAWLEFTGRLECTWYKADHNDSMLRVPPSTFKVVASLTTIPPRAAACHLAIDSLLSQVDHVYLSVSKEYRRFGAWEMPGYLLEGEYASKVTVVVTEDRGPATKYVGALDHIPKGVWVFVCDDDQEYQHTLVKRMKESVAEIAVYQNHYENIRQKTSGGLVHGYVGLLAHSSVLEGLREFPLPEAAYFVDDQWMSIYCFLKGVPVRKTAAEHYVQIFQVLFGGHEKIGTESLAAMDNRDEKVQTLAAEFGAKFLQGGEIVNLTTSPANV